MIRVLLRAPGFVAIDKPAGALVIPGRGAERTSLREDLARKLGQPVWVVHRIDRDTSGVLLFALDADTHRVLSMAFEHGKVHKRYLALVEGTVTGPLELAGALIAGRKGRMRLTRPGEEGKAALTRVRPIETFAFASLVEAVPVTGRTHQIRVHLAAAGHPLVFDHQYGRRTPVRASDLGGEGEAVVLERTPLHCTRLDLPALEHLAPATIESPLPEDLTAALERLRAAQGTR